MLLLLSAERKMGSATSEHFLYIARTFCGASVPQNLLSSSKDTLLCSCGHYEICAEVKNVGNTALYRVFRAFLSLFRPYNALFAPTKIQTGVTLIQIWRVGGCRILKVKGLTSGQMRPNICNIRTQKAFILSVDISIFLSIDRNIYLPHYKFICLYGVRTIDSRITKLICLSILLWILLSIVL